MINAAQIDHEILSGTAEVAALTTAVMALDQHPGHGHLRRFTPTGATAKRWTLIEPAIGQLWVDLASVTSTLESGRALRGRRPAPDDDVRAQLGRIFHGRGGFGEVVNRMWRSLRDAQEFLTTVDEVNATVASGLAPLLKRLDAIGAATPAEITHLLAVSATDPLSSSLDEIRRRVTAIAAIVDDHCAECAALEALRTNWSEEVAATHDKLAVLRDAEEQAAQTRARAEQAVAAGPLPLPVDSESGLLIELEALSEPDPARLLNLQRRIDAALQLVRHCEGLAHGLLARRDELNGRLRAYEAKAARLGLAENRDVLSSRRIASGLLSRRPCDLPAVTRAVADYQRAVTGKREVTP